MKRNMFLSALLALSLMLTVGCAATSATPTSNPTGAPTGTVEASATPAQTGTAVTIEGDKFSPAELTIKVGDTVTWTNLDSVNHTIVFDTFQSTSLKKNDTYQHTFDTAGTFDYICSIHTFMKATIIVK